MQVESQWSNQAVLDELGKRLARHRLHQNLTQEELAREAGTGINTVYRIEQGHSTQLSNLMRILRVLGLLSNLDALVPEPPPSPIEQAKLRREGRKRASHRKDEGPAAGWTWDDES